MFNLEIKRISLRSIVLSAYPFVVFIYALLSSFFSLGELIDPGTGYFKILMQFLIYSLINTGVIVLFTMIACLIYNLLASFGMKGIKISLAEVEEKSEEEDSSAKAVEEQEENKTK